VKLKIAIVVHGRFHAFDLARALLARGHEVVVLTNYPKFAVKRFGLPPSCVRSFRLHGGLSRAAMKLQRRNLMSYPEAYLQTLFGRWAAMELSKERWDVVHLWSGVGEEILNALSGTPTLKLTMRGSAHIRTQARLLGQEMERTGVRQDRPSDWIIAREEREYALTDRIITLSTFAYDSFIAEGVPAEKLFLLPLGANLQSFRPPPEVVEARCQRILSGRPLQVLYVGSLLYRKGLHDLAITIKQVTPSERIQFRFIGSITQEAESLVTELEARAEFVGKRPQAELPHWYAQGDLFILPTIEDGFAVTLTQANSSALPVLTTTNIGGPDFIKHGQTGWLLPIRNPEAFAERLRWCDSHRPALADMVRHIYHDHQSRDWHDVAVDFEDLCVAYLSEPSQSRQSANG